MRHLDHPRIRTVPLLLMLLSACVRGPRPVPVPPTPGRIEGFTAEYRLTWTGKDGARKARLAAVFSPPRRLRLEILDPLGTSRAVLVATEAGAVLIDPRGKRFRSYPKASEALRDLSGLDLPIELFPWLLLGNLDRFQGMECFPADDTGQEERDCQGPGGKPRIRIAAGGRQWEVSRAGADSVFVEFKAVPGSPPVAPRWIRLREAAGGRAAELELREFRFEPPPAELFSLEAPAAFHDATLEPLPSWNDWTQP